MIDRILGVLGGMGPLASAHFMTRLTLLTPASIDQEHIPAVLWSDPRVPDRGKALRGGTDPLAALCRAIDGLQDAGCGAIAMPCNTAHGWFDKMQAHAKVPILHIADAAAAELRKIAAPGSRVGILGTAATLQMRLYQTHLGALGWETIEPSDQDMAEFVTPAIALVKANRLRDSFAPVAQALENLARRGAQAVVLGCTELPLAVQSGPVERLTIPLVDTIDALALAAIAWARGTAPSDQTATRIGSA